MRFFIDTAEFDEIKEAYDFGFIDGVTTNPSLIVKAKRDLKQVISEIANLVDGPVSAEVISSDAEGMVAEAHDLVKLGSNVAASVRTPLHIIQCAKAGAHIATVPFKVLMQAMKHPLTDAGLAKFMEDWKQANQ